MELTTGSRLGPYEIVSRVGAGGMGEVYRARDHRLDRDVAVKIIAAAIAADPAVLARFEREARAVARLSHPNIVAIYDMGQQDGHAYAVMELLQGEPLRRRLQSGALPVRKAAEIAIQVARGLAAAHESGIVHRDLKPENVFVSADGLVKILDFGLAQARRAGAPGESALTRMDGSLVTAPGTLLCTPGYMAPEQVQGLTVDHRCDIFALGAVLAEMLTGRRAFSGESWLDVTNAVVRGEPDLTASSAVPPPLQRVVLRCLEKQPHDRFSSARDLAFALEAAGDVASMGNPAVRSTPASRSARRAVAWFAGAVGALGIAATAFLAMRGNADHPADGAAVSMRLLLPGPPGNINVFQFSPDGRMVVALVRGDPSPGSSAAGPFQASVWVCDLSRGEWRSIAPSNSTTDAFLTPVAWSPDSRSVLYQGLAGGAVELRVADVASSAVRSIARVEEAAGASWSRESGILVGGRTLRPLSPDSGRIQDVLAGIRR